MNKVISAAVLAAILFGAGQAAAQDQTEGGKLYKAVCRNCHGPTAKGMASFPRLAGRDFDYLASRLQTYRSGEAIGPNSALMMPIASELSDDDIANVSSFISANFD